MLFRSLSTSRRERAVRLRLCHRSKTLWRRRHGDHGDNTKSVPYDIPAHRLAGANDKGRQKRSSHRPGRNAAGVEGDRRKYLWTKKDRQTAMTYPCTMNQKIEIPDSTQKMESSTETPAGAVAFSLLVTGTAGLWMLEDE